MERINEIYSDGIGKIHFYGGVIRLDLFSFEPSDVDGEAPQRKVTDRIIMSPNAFLSSFDSFVNMIEKLKDAGIVATVEEKADNTPDNSNDNNNN